MVLLLVGALFCFLVVAVTGFQWFGANLDAIGILGWLGLGLSLVVLYWIVPVALGFRRQDPA